MLRGSLMLSPIKETGISCIRTDKNEILMHVQLKSHAHKMTVPSDPTYFGKGCWENASFPPQLSLEPSVFVGLGDVCDHFAHLHRELVTHGGLKVDQHQHLCRDFTNGAEN